MENRRESPRIRTLRGGKIVLNRKGSVIDCTIRNLSSQGACLHVETVVDVPPTFDLKLDEWEAPRACKLIWQSTNRLGVEFKDTSATVEIGAASSSLQAVQQARSSDIVRSELLRLRAALDEVKFGVVLLDGELRAQFINRAFRKMWRLPDLQADAHPAFVALMYHGRDTRAYEIPDEELDSYIAQRVAHVKAGSSEPIDVRLANGEAVRFQCIVLPDGGRMLSYTYVTNIVRHADQLDVLRAALHQVQEGVLLLDTQLTVQFMNRALRELWGVSDEQVERKPSYAELVNDARFTRAYGVAPEELDAFISRRIALVKAGDATPIDLPVSDGRTIRSQCTALPDGGRMLTYTDVTDLVRHAEELERLATTDSITGVYNRRHFHVLGTREWDRFQRYHRPLSLLMFDIDRFKSINDGRGHNAGDCVMTRICELASELKRGTDILARIGGDEFALLLPETGLREAEIVANRLCLAVQEGTVVVDDGIVTATISIGVAAATLGQSGIDALMKAADEALYKAKSGGRGRVALHAPKLPGDYKTAAE